MLKKIDCVMIYVNDLAEAVNSFYIRFWSLYPASGSKNAKDAIRIGIYSQRWRAEMWARQRCCAVT